MLHRIRKIIDIAPYTITCEWTNGEVRAIHMENKLKEWADEPDSVYKKLRDHDTFLQVKLDPDSKTLYWNGLMQMMDVSGNLFDTVLDIDPEVLYEMSALVNNQGSIAA